MRVAIRDRANEHVNKLKRGITKSESMVPYSSMSLNGADERSALGVATDGSGTIASEEAVESLGNPEGGEDGESQSRPVDESG